MNYNVIIGLSIILLVALGACYGLHRITKPVAYTKEEYEKRLKKSSGIAGSAMNAMLYPFQEWWNPKAVEAIHVIKDMREGYYNAQQDSGDGLGEYSLVVSHMDVSKQPHNTRKQTNGISGLLRRALDVFRLRR
jgi:hypothetical protein